MVLLKNWQGILHMEEMGFGKGGCNVMWMLDCNCSHKNQNIMAMEAIMALV